MDGLTEEERALAWEASWHPSFAGIAIVGKDFRFRSVNPQFCEIVGASPAELINVRFQDITPPPIKQLDENNAKLVMERVIEHYILPKSYEFANGRKIEVVLLVRGVYDKEGKFLFFVSRIMLDEGKVLEKSVIPSQERMTILDFIKTYAQIFVAAGTVVGAMAWAILERIKDGH